MSVAEEVHAKVSASMLENSGCRLVPPRSLDGHFAAAPQPRGCLPCSDFVLQSKLS